MTAKHAFMHARLPFTCGIHRMVAFSPHPFQFWISPQRFILHVQKVLKLLQFPHQLSFQWLWSFWMLRFLGNLLFTGLVIHRHTSGSLVLVVCILMKYEFRYCKFIATVAQVSTGDVAWTDAPILFSQCMQVVMWHMRLISTTHAWQYAEKGFYTSFFSWLAWAGSTTGIWLFSCLTWMAGLSSLMHDIPIFSVGILGQTMVQCTGATQTHMHVSKGLALEELSVDDSECSWSFSSTFMPGKFQGDASHELATHVCIMLPGKVIPAVR